MRYRIVTDFATYEIEDCEIVGSAMFGVCLSARYRVEGEDHWQERGTFRCDRIISIEAVDEQLELRAA